MLRTVQILSVVFLSTWLTGSLSAQEESIRGTTREYSGPWTRLCSTGTRTCISNAGLASQSGSGQSVVASFRRVRDCKTPATIYLTVTFPNFNIRVAGVSILVDGEDQSLIHGHHCEENKCTTDPIPVDDTFKEKLAKGKRLYLAVKRLGTVMVGGNIPLTDGFKAGLCLK